MAANSEPNIVSGVSQVQPLQQPEAQNFTRLSQQQGAELFNQLGCFNQPAAKSQLAVPNQQNFLRIASWTLSNLCGGCPRLDLDINSVLATIQMILSSVDDANVLSNVCWALSHLCDGSSVYIEYVFGRRFASNLCSC